MTAGLFLLVLGFAAAIGASSYFDWRPKKHVRSDDERFVDAALSAGGYIAINLAYHLRPDLFVDWFGQSANMVAAAIVAVVLLILLRPAKNAIIKARR